MISHGGNPFQVICDETPDNDFPPHFLFLQEFSPFRPPFSLDEADLVSTNGTSHRPSHTRDARRVKVISSRRRPGPMPAVGAKYCQGYIY
jgi:hypothetical protein